MFLEIMTVGKGRWAATKLHCGLFFNRFLPYNRRCSDVSLFFSPSPPLNILASCFFFSQGESAQENCKMKEKNNCTTTSYYILPAHYICKRTQTAFDMRCVFWFGFKDTQKNNLFVPAGFLHSFVMLKSIYGQTEGTKPTNFIIKMAEIQTKALQH